MLQGWQHVGLSSTTKTSNVETNQPSPSGLRRCYVDATWESNSETGSMGAVGMDMSGRIPMSLPEIMEFDESDLSRFVSGTEFSVESTSTLGGGGSQPWETVTNTLETVNPVMPMADTVSAATHDVNAADQQTNQRARKRQRRNPQQIQELEKFFETCPHPNEDQRKELSLALGMEPIQVKFWFQNKRTQLKAVNERQDNSQLRAEIEKLRMENLKCKEALAASSCSQCGGPSMNEVSLEEHNKLKLENAQLKEEIARISSIASRSARMPSESTSRIYDNSDEATRTINGLIEAEKPVITELALAAMDELLLMAQLTEPLWVSSMDPNTEVVLNIQEYARFFSQGIIAIANREGFWTEASRETALVKTNYAQLLGMFMNVDRWATLFSDIVSRAVTVGVVSIGVAGNYDGALQVINADFQVPAPQVAPRNYYFARYCKKNVDGRWAIVDVSIDRYLCMNRVGRCMRRPSGCLIEELPNGYAKITWVEHVEVDNDVNEDTGIYKALLHSGMAFGAKRWVTMLDQQCERIACSLSINVPPTIDNLVTITPEGKKCILKLAERMVTSYMCGLSCSESPNWKVLSGSGAGVGDIRVMIRKVLNEPGVPSGVLLCGVTSLWLPIEPKRVFDFFQDERTRTQWDIFFSSGPLTEVARITYGREIDNCVSLFKGANTSQSNMMILQESSSNPTGSYIIYGLVDMKAMTLLCRGGDPKFVSVLPCGFAILPDGPPGTASLLTMAFQVLVDSDPIAMLSPESVATVNQLIKGTVEKIKTCLFDNRT
ncbi:homeobox-leucine zipper protein HDG2-like [Ipomoea triloba]|uniref:homeobox-leucine zipper protein HDG2-like n=1 Tax=Ipomoea triloba TaxID=35885 RepID=UPI00125DEC61|nr:homeobox-leucine zipper protein HDG2-like [Ipomoea triloba]